MAEGTVVMFDVEQGYGVIAPSDGRDRLWFDASSVATPGHPVLHEGQRVGYQVSTGPAGRRAVEVVPLR